MTAKSRMVWNSLRSIPYLLFLNAVHGSRIRIPQAYDRLTRIRIIGKGSRVDIEKKCVFEDNVLLWVERGGHLAIGEKVFINRNTTITCVDTIEIGSGTQIANNVTIVDHDHDFRHVGESSLVSDKVIIGKNVWIGANCVVLKGTSIGDGSVIAAGSIVNGNIPQNSIYIQKRDATIQIIDSVKK